VRITWISPYLDIVLDEIPTDSKKILEVGCGSGIFGYILKKTRPDATLHGVEPFDYPLDHYDQIFRMEWVEFIRRNKEKYDVLVCNETVEHMEKKDALEFLENASNITGKAIVGTPYKFDQQPAYDNNPYQVHKSVISVKEFKKCGYEPRIIGFSDKHGKTRMVYSPEKKLYPAILGMIPTNIIAIKLNS
jgi:hypothetical protein